MATQRLSQLTPDQMALLEQKGEATFDDVRYNPIYSSSGSGEGGDGGYFDLSGYTTYNTDTNPYGSYQDYDINGLLTGTHEGQRGMSPGDFAKLLAPVLLNIVLPGAGSAIGALVTEATGIAVGTAAQTAIGNAVIGTVLNGGDVKKGALNALAGYAGGQVANSDAVAGALKDAGITNTTVTNALKNAASGATSALVRGQDIGTGALAGATGSLLKSGLTYASDKSGLTDSLTDKQLTGTTTAAAAYAAAKLRGATDAQAAIAAATAAGTSAFNSGAQGAAKEVPVTDLKPTSFGTNTDADFWKSIGIDPATTGQWTSPSNQEILDIINGTSGASTNTTADNTAAADTVLVKSGTGATGNSNDVEPGFDTWKDPTTVDVTNKRLTNASTNTTADNTAATDLGTVNVTNKRLTNAGDEHVFDPGNTATDLGTVNVTDKKLINAGDEHVFDPGNTATDLGTVNVTDKKLINAGDEHVFDPGNVATDPGTVNVTDKKLINAGDEHVFDPGTTYNAGDEHVFNPGVKTADTDKKVTDSGIKVTNSGIKVTPKATTPTPVGSGPGTNISNSSTPGTNNTSEYDPGLVELMEQIFGSSLNTPMAKPVSPNKAVKAAHGGSIEDLLKLLRS